MFRSKGTWRSNRRDHTKLQIVFMHTNVSTCDFLRFDANDKGDFEAQKLEKSWFFMIFSTSESSKKFLKCRMISKWVCKMFYKCRAFKWYELQGCTMCQTVFNYKNETLPPQSNCTIWNSRLLNFWKFMWTFKKVLNFKTLVCSE